MLTTKVQTWDDGMDQKLEKVYQMHRREMWAGVARDMEMEWRAVEDRAWDLGKKKFVKKL